MTALPPPVARMLHDAHTLLHQGDSLRAEQAVRPLLAAFPNRPEILQLLGLIQRARGALTEAHATLLRAVDVGGGAEVRNTLGNLLVTLGEVGPADDQFRAAIAAQPDYAAAWINCGRLASRRGHHAEALRCLRQACRLQPDLALAHVSLGNALRAAGHAREAVEVLRRAVTLSPHASSTRVHLGIALAAAHRPREAIQEYDVAERTGFCDPHLLDNRAASRIEIGDVAGAQADFDRLVVQSPEYLPGHRGRARFYREFGLAGDPFASFAAVARALPSKADIWSEWLSTLLSYRQFGDAIAVAGQARRATGDRPEWNFARAIALSGIGEMAEAQAAFDASATALGDSMPFINALTTHLIKSGEAGRAGETASRGTRIDPEDQLCWANLGIAWRLLGDPREHWLNDYENHVEAAWVKPPSWGGSAEEFARHAAGTLRALHLASHHPPDQSLRNGTQTAGALFDRPEAHIRLIKEAVLAQTARYVARLLDDPNHPFLRRKAACFGFAGSWSVRLQSNGYHVNHVHPRGWISSAYYFALPDQEDSDEADAGYLQLGAPPTSLKTGLRPRRTLQPQVGQLVLFPSIMWHGTVPFSQTGERLTAAFDLVPM